MQVEPGSCRSIWGGTCTEISKNITSNRVEFTGGDARINGRHHRITGAGNDASGAHETLKILVAINRHDEIVC